MSNDISSQRLPIASAPMASSPAAKVVEVSRQQDAATAKAVELTLPDPKETRRELEEATEHLNQQMKRDKRDLSFSVDDVANKVVVTVKNREGEVVRQIPNEVALRVAHNIDNVKGLMQDEKS